MKMKEIILLAENFIKSDKFYNECFPDEISAPIMASFVEPIISNELNISKSDLILQAKTFLIEEQLEEIDYCFDEFVEAMSKFASEFISNQTNIHSLKC